MCHQRGYSTCAALSYRGLSAWGQLSFKLIHCWAILCLAIATLFWIGGFILFKIDMDVILKMPSIPNASYILDFSKQLSGFQQKEV